jgi:probable HAF family extracellular repeat protein
MEDMHMIKHPSVYSMTVLVGLMTSLICSPVWAAPIAGSLVGWGYNGYGQTNVPAGNDFVAIAAGDEHSLALKSDGSLAGWGDNYYGATNVPAGNDFVAIAAGYHFSLALKSDGSLAAWGLNEDGQTNVPAGNDFVAIAAAYFDGLALRSDGSLVGWGRNRFGESNVPAGNDFVAIAAGVYHGLALKSAGSLVGWGYNGYGQTNVPAGNDFVAIAAGDEHSLALKSDGSLVGWGNNWEGQTDVPAGHDFTAIAGGFFYSLALKSDGSLAGWGRNDVGQTDVPAGNRFVAIAAGWEHGLAIQQAPEPATLALVFLGAAALAIRRSRRSTNFLCLCCALSVTTAAYAASYTVTDLGTLGGTESFGSGLNAGGQVTGASYTTGGAAFHTFLWTPTTPNGASGTKTDLGTLGGTQSFGNGLNASGQVAGESSTTGDTAIHAFLWKPSMPNGASGTMHDLLTLGGTDSYGYGINAAGQITGASDTTGDSTTHAFLWKPSTPNGTSGTMHNLGTLGGTESNGSAINASGQVSGSSLTNGDAHYRAFLWKPTTPNGTSGTMYDLGTLGGTESFGGAINTNGQVAGFSYTTGHAAYHAFLWTPSMPNGTSGAMLDLGTLGGLNSYSYNLGSSGAVVGASEIAMTSDSTHAFLYTSGSGMVDLNTMIDPLSGWELLDAADINEEGQITGQGLIGGQYHAYLLTPISLPGDFNHDGSVDAADYVVWRKGVGVAPTPDNYNLWRANFGQTAGSGSGATGFDSAIATVPEPTTQTTFVAAIMLMLACQRASTGSAAPSV